MTFLDFFRPRKRTMSVPERRDVETRFLREWKSLFGPSNTTSGTTVTELSAFRLAAVSQAVQLIAEELATLPLEVWRVGTDTRERARLHPAYKLIRWAPSPIYTAWEWKRTTMLHTLLYGNGISEIVRDSQNRPTAIWPLVPWRIQMFLFEVTGSERVVQYRYTPVRGAQRTIQPEDIIHIRAMDSDTGLWGESPVLRCAGAIGLTQAAQDFAAAFFGAGSTLSGVLTHPGSLSEEAYKSLKQSWSDAHQAGPASAYRPAILEEGMDWKPTGTPPEEGQMIQTRDQQVKEISRVFNIPPHRLGASTDSFTYSSEVMERQAFYQSTIRPWATQIEQELNAKLLGRGFESDFDFAEALRSDQKSRFESHASAISAGWLKKNEVRLIEGMNEIDGLDDEPEPVVPVADPDVEIDVEPDAERAALYPVLYAAVDRMLGRQIRQLDELHEDRREDFFMRQLEAWRYALDPIAATAHALGVTMNPPETLAQYYTALHAGDVAQGLDLTLAWSADDITEDIRHG